MSSVVFAEKGLLRKGERSTQLPRIIAFSTDLRRFLGDTEHLCVKREGEERARGCERCRKKMESIEKRNQLTNICSFHFLSAPRRGTSLPSSASRREGERSWSLSSAEAKREGDERETERERERQEKRGCGFFFLSSNVSSIPCSFFQPQPQPQLSSLLHSLIALRSSYTSADTTLPLAIMPAAAGSSSSTSAPFIESRRELIWFPVPVARKRPPLAFFSCPSPFPPSPLPPSPLPPSPSSHRTAALAYSGLTASVRVSLSSVTPILLGRGCSHPESLRRTGATTSAKVTAADAGLPGRLCFCF